ncbi:hypothetical protein EOT10_26935 [Streptomyces antnestii]|uniref:Uncharacterized protein n=1 Tax=Streptomyces antnestii TaxID=2494256 RepID=A0A3S2XR44_9ACTN|nr:hypothetical protein [Streptomyces sp. San01]RVU20961.1 hypothetical protein EOT10_26935 [Streptomyces sp. San01]
MEPETNSQSSLFGNTGPWDVVYDDFVISYSQFWVAARDGADFTTAIPAGEEVKGNGQAVGIPAASQETRVEVALSYWQSTPPDGVGKYLGSAVLDVPNRELRCLNVEGREEPAVLVLPDDGSHEVKVWRRNDLPEQYDIRVSECPDD